MIVAWLTTALGAGPAPEEGSPGPSPELEALASELESVRAALWHSEHTRTDLEAEIAALEARLAALEAQHEAARVLLDDRLGPRARSAAAEALGASGDPRVLGLLRGATHDPAVQLAVARAALSIDDPEAVAVAVAVLHGAPPRPIQTEVVQALGDQGSDEAGRALWELLTARDIPAAVRSEARAILELRYPGLLAALGPPHSVVDPLGGATFVLASGTAGGVLMSSVGIWGQFEGAPAIGGLGGSAIGLGTSTLVARARPLTAGQGLAYSSAVAWGLAASLWTTSAIHGAWAWIDARDRAPVVDAAAAYRAVGVAAGAGIGAWSLGREPDPWDVLEVNTAGYLGSAVALSTAGLLGYRPPPECCSVGRQEAYRTYRRDASRWLEASSLAGAGLGLGTGLLLRRGWSLDLQDAAFAIVAGGEAAWIGATLPAALGIDDRELKGTVRLPWNATIAGGLALSERWPVSAQRTVVTGLGALAGNAVGAGLPLIVTDGDLRSVNQVMVPVGLAGTVGAHLATPLLDPRDGDYTMLGIGAAVASAQGAWVGAALDDLGVLSRPRSQVPGISLLAGGLATSGLLIASPGVEPGSDAMLVLGTAAAWGAGYGALAPVALRLDPEPAGILLPTAITSGAGVAAAGLALLPTVGLQPRQTVVPQLVGLSGGTTGALLAALVSAEAEDVALGTLIGSTLGLGGGALLEARRSDRRLGLAPPWLPRPPGRWAPLVASAVGHDGSPIPVWGIQGVGW